MAQSIISNTVVSGVGRVVTIILGIGTTAMVTRYLGAADFGTYALLLSIGTMLQIAADFGLYLTLARDIANPGVKEQSLFEAVATLRVVLLIAWFILAGLVLVALPAYRGLWLPFLIIAVGLIAQSSSQLLMGVYQKYKQVWKATLGDVVGRALQLAVVGMLAWGASPAVVSDVSGVSATALAFLLGAAGAYGIHAALVPHIKPFRWRVSPAEWRTIAAVSWPLGLLLLLNVIYFRADIVVISMFRPSAEVGWYGLAYRIIESGLFFPAMFGGLLLPQFAYLYARNQFVIFERLLSQALYAISIAAVGATGALLLFARDIVVFLSGNEFIATAPILRVLAVALGVMFFGNIFGFALVSLHKQKQLLWLYVALVTLNIVTNVIFIPVFGAIAAAWTTLFTEAVATIGAGYLVWRVVKYSLPLRVVGSALALLAACALVIQLFPSSWHVLLRLSLFVLLYGSGAFFLKLIDRKRMTLLLNKQAVYEA